MADTVTCPQLEDFLNSENCQENIGGTSAILYVFNKADLSAKIARTDNVYSTPAFKAGKGEIHQRKRLLLPALQQKRHHAKRCVEHHASK